MYPPTPTSSRSVNNPFSGSYKVAFINKKTGISYPLVDYEDTVPFMVLWEEVASINNGKELHLLGSSENIGGPFFVFRNKLEGGLTSIGGIEQYDHASDPDYIIKEMWSGTLFPMQVQDMGYPPPIHSDYSQMRAWGAEAVAKAAPGTVPTNLTNTLIELKREGLPSIVGSTLKSRSSVAKKAGDEYLNVQFGWRPLVNDVTSLVETVTKSDQILAQLERDSGKTVRRRVTLEEGWETVSSDIVGSNSPNLAGFSGLAIDRLYPSSQLRLTVRQYRKVWFSGSFTYYLPSDYYSRNKVVSAAAKARILSGLELSPNVLWNAAPWSWAADWFSNAGDVISNCQRFLTEGLVMHHGYIMEHTIHEYTYESSNGLVPPLKLITETKGRLKANPFGFDIDWPDLSGFQVSILAALGMSRRG